MWLKRLSLVWLAGIQLSVFSTVDLEILVGTQKRKIDSRQNRGLNYYELKDIADTLGLKLEERGDQLTLSGSRGRLVLTDNRPLVRFEDQYLLLASPIWKRKEKNWYVPEDLLTKALPFIISLKLEKVAAGQYRLAPLPVNRVRVQLANYPDHVRIFFQPSQRAPVRVRELSDYLQVEFGDYLVRPELPDVQPDPRMVSSLQFNPQDVYGTFRIYKGKAYYNFREFTLQDPERKVIEVYAPPASAAGAPEAFPPLVPEPAPDAVASPAGSAPADPAALLSRVLPPNVVTIDPGHGGENYGVRPSQELLEKNFTLRIASRIEQRLSSTGYRPLLTRRRDVDLPPEQRSSIANYYRSRAYVSVHVGGSPAEAARGPVVYVHRYAASENSENSAPLLVWEEAQRNHREQSRRLGELIQQELNTLYGTDNRVVEAPLTVLAPVAAPAVLVEVGFLTNEADSRQLLSPEFQDQIAQAVASGILQFLK